MMSIPTATAGKRLRGERTFRRSCKTVAAVSSWDRTEQVRYCHFMWSAIR